MVIRKWIKEGEALLQEIQDTKVPANMIAMWHLGQVGFVYKNQDTVVYIDPLLNDLGEDGKSVRWYRWPFEPQQVRADYVICTHNHADHLAPETLKGIAEGDPHTKFLIPAPHRQVLLDAGIAEDRIIGLKAKEKVTLPGFEVLPVSAAHPVHETDAEGNDVSLCYHMTMGEVSLLHMGDTYLTDQLFADLKALPKADLFFPPINGGDYFRTARNCIGNLEMIEAATLAQILGVDVTIPTHYDMIMGNNVDPLHFLKVLWELDPALKSHITGLGERYIYMK